MAGSPTATKLGVAGCCCGSGGGTSGVIVIITGCYCQDLPETISMTSADPMCNFQMFQNASFTYQAVPPEYASLVLGDMAYISDQSFPDPLLGGATFQYLLTCVGNEFELTRIYPEAPFGSPYRDGMLYTWLVGAGVDGVTVNTCDPFVMALGSAFPGSDASCCVSLNTADCL